MSSARDWSAEIDRWTERFAHIPNPPEPFATALRDGWDPNERDRLVAEAEAYAQRHAAYLHELRDSGVDLVRFDAKQGTCGACERYVGCAYSLSSEPSELPSPPPLPICPACRHTLNLLTPFFLQSIGLDMDDLIAASVPFEPDIDPV